MEEVMNDRRKFLRGFGIAGAVLAGAATVTKIQMDDKHDIDPQILAELKESDMCGCITFISNYNDINPQASWKVGRDGKMYIKENEVWRKA
jgi:hypothetical protein